MSDASQESPAREAPSVRVVLTTAPDAEAGKSLARALVAERLVACVNIVPAVTSIYRWKSVVEEASEVLLVAKTAADRVDALGHALARLHPYETPEFVVLEAGLVAPRYAAWVVEETR